MQDSRGIFSIFFSIKEACTQVQSKEAQQRLLLITKIIVGGSVSLEQFATSNQSQKELVFRKDEEIFFMVVMTKIKSARWSQNETKRKIERDWKRDRLGTRGSKMIETLSRRICM